MNKFLNCYYCFILCSVFMCNFKCVHNDEGTPLHLNYRGKYTSDIKSYEIVIPQRVNKDGSFISHLVSHHHSKRSTKELELIFYKIPIAGEEYLIELTPNRKLISPEAVVEIHKEDAGKLSKRGGLNESSNDEKIGRMFENLNIKKLKNTECHFHGHVKGENTSKAALSTCYGLAGFIQIRKGFYTIEPVAEHNPFVEDAYPHILYKTDSLENSSVCQIMGELKTSLADQVVRRRRESNIGVSTPTYIETLIVMDKTLINHHQDSDCENYVLTVFNMMNLRVNRDAEKTLQYFQNWQYDINPGDDSHPNHHDIAVLITRVNVCNSPSSCGLLGLTTIGKACDPKLSAALCEDNGLRLGYVIAHEIGHLLGADHDLPNTTCIGTTEDGLLTVMYPQVSLTAQTWSKCSQDYFKAFFDNGMGSCLFDEPEEHYFNVQDMLPGVMYNSDFQCKHLISMSARECDMGSTCESLNCFIPGYACIVTHTPPADGTRCGESMWCRDTKCLMIGERPGAIDGNWGEWSAWSECSRTCGSGVSSSVRNCDKPQPSHGGKYCVGERKRYKVCAATKPSFSLLYCMNSIDLIRFISEEVNVSFVGKPCESGRPSFRDIQCGEFDDWIYPEDGKIHTWRAHYFHDDNPCILYCINEKKQIAALRPRVVDGTMCYRGIRDICVEGTCKSLPCDLHFESNAVEDACGICHGDGTACEFSEGMEMLTMLPKGLTKLVNVPAGTRNIKVEEMSPTLARIIVRDKDTKDIYIRGKTLGMFNVPGSQAWLGMIKKNQEALNIPGPVTKPLSIWIQRLEDVTVKWSMALPAEQQRKPEFAWDFLKWGPCSAKCGPGTQKSAPSCMEEKAGLVEASFCAELEMPPTKVRPCELSKCEPRWMVGDWKGCEQPVNAKKERKRVVYCIKTIGEGEGESQIVADSQCPSPKPHSKEPCENRQKREDTEYDNGIFEDVSMYRSDTAEFGFHKKYDDYLKHFAALSVPQRKSETIPLHLVSSPHFKHYFRVLETPEDNENESSSDLDVNLSLTNDTISDSQTQNKVSPDFYRNTFSGNPIDISHMQSKFCKVRKRNIASIEEGGVKNSISGRKVNTKQGQRKSKQYKRERVRGQMEKGSDGMRDKKLSSFKFQTPNNILRKRYLHKILSKEHNHPQWGKTSNQRNKNKYFQSSRDARNLREKLFSSKHNKKSFNYTSPNLSHYIENLAGGNSRLKNQYLHLMGKIGQLTPFEKAKLRNYQWNAYNPRSYSQKINSFFKPFAYFSDRLGKGTEMNEDSEKYEYSTDSRRSELRKINNNEFDGSGIRKFNFETTKVTTAPPSNGILDEIKKYDLEKWVGQERKFFSNPFDPKSFPRYDFHSRRSDFNERPIALEDLFFDRTKRYQKLRKDFFMKKRSVLPPHQKRKLKADVLYPQQRNNHKTNIKRSSHKWKKSKAKDINSKTSKELSSTGCGTETRNYLNNLFRDSHPKIFANKQKPKQQIQKPVIDTGRLVIDTDSPDEQHVEILFQENEVEETPHQRFTQLVRPPYNQRKISLRGQEVFDLLQTLQQRRERSGFYRTGAGETNKNVSLDKIEVNVKVPETEKNDTENSNAGKTTTNEPPKSSTQAQGSSTTPAPDSKTDSKKPAEAQTQENSTKAQQNQPPTEKPKEKTPESKEEKPSTTKAPQETTTTTTTETTTTTTTKQPTNTTESPSDDSDSGCPDYDVDETIDNSGNANDSKSKKKEKKKKKKGKEKVQSDDNDGGDVIEYKLCKKEDDKEQYTGLYRRRGRLRRPQELRRKRRKRLPQARGLPNYIR